MGTDRQQQQSAAVADDVDVLASDPAKAFNYALNQWAMYADESRGPGWPFGYIADSADGGDAESMQFRSCATALARLAPPDQPPAEGEVQRRCWTLYMHPDGNGQCRLYNGHDGDHDFGAAS